ncbi:hypothetical protein Rsub_01460 [Raphidocelis subcapitata]|uniref:Uncharacterized protein n=1 Tax=Raphidocelis subcapitata TaxID=307507 RepID=A0A2V0NN32_9CHLO|nr:hypothetical protein Rsub_01460 [Raphidocelis subcapitata]|eukprot:GBF88961.1 hypothetical protein Rsub_01460 [Raphidocelis subcapitata]
MSGAARPGCLARPESGAKGRGRPARTAGVVAAPGLAPRRPRAPRRAPPAPAAAAAAGGGGDGPGPSGRGELAAELAAVLSAQLGLAAADADAAASALAAAGVPPAAAAARAAALRARFRPADAAALARLAPRALAVDVPAWLEFLRPWAPDGGELWKLLRYHHEALAATSVFTAGRAILFLKSLGWTDADVARRLLPCHCALLAREEAELAAVVARLRALEIDEARVRDLLFQCPGLLYEFGDEQLALAERAFEVNRTKYAFMGSYEV